MKQTYEPMYTSCYKFYEQKNVLRVTLNNPVSGGSRLGIVFYQNYPQNAYISIVFDEKYPLIAYIILDLELKYPLITYTLLELKFKYPLISKHRPKGRLEMETRFLFLEDVEKEKIYRRLKTIDAISRQKIDIRVGMVPVL